MMRRRPPPPAAPAMMGRVLDDEPDEVLDEGSSAGGLQTVSLLALQAVFTARAPQVLHTTQESCPVVF